MLAAGFEIERYVVEGVLGEGGMAVVYMVRHGTLGTRHALKVLSVGSTAVRERLIQEGQVQATLKHPNIVAVTDVIDVQGAPGLLMEYVEGAGLDHWLDYYQPTLDEAVTVFKAIVAGVGHAHAQNLIHRDLKPGNVMLHVTEAGVIPKVTDFGLAKATGAGDLRRTRTGSTMGTPAYMAPEQIRDSSSVDRRADLYSLGIILYELVAGRTPYEEEDLLELFSLVRAGKYPDPRTFRPEIPDAVVNTIDALITVKPEDRVSDCASILEMLTGTGDPATISAGSVESLGPPRPIPPLMVTTLPPMGPGAVAARGMIQPVQPIPAGPVDDASWRGRVNPSLPQNLEPPPPRPSMVSMEAPAPAKAAFGILTLLGIGAMLFLLVVVVILLAAVLVGGDGEDVPVPPPVHVQPVPVVTPAPVAPVPAPTQPEPVEPVGPVPVKPAPTKPVPRPRPVKPRPAPVKPRPAPVKPAPVRPSPVRPAPPKPQPAPSGGTFSVDTDRAMAVTLQSSSGPSYGPGHVVPAGDYEILINGRGGAGKVTIRKGRNARLKCVASANKCKVL